VLDNNLLKCGAASPLRHKPAFFVFRWIPILTGLVTQIPLKNFEFWDEILVDGATQEGFWKPSSGEE